MAEETNGANVSFTTKEMLVRMDGKLDVLAARQTHYDVELALLKERQHQLEVVAASEGTGKAQLAAELKEQRAKMDAEVAAIRDELSKVGRKLAYATGTIAGMITLVEVVSRLWPK